MLHGRGCCSFHGTFTSLPRANLPQLEPSNDARIGEALMLIPKPLIPTLRRFARALARPYTPLNAHVVVTRRCNLACGYCNEYDHFSPPIPVAELRRRVDRLRELGTVMVTLTGGEPLIHPQLDEVVTHVTSAGMVGTVITNGYPLTRVWIERLNRARLTALQISIDNVEPGDVSQKSWSRLKPRLHLLRDHAKFSVVVNAVLGSSDLDETRSVVAEARKMGFYMSVGLLHDGNGQLDKGQVGDEGLELYEEIRSKSRRIFFHRFGEGWERRLLRDGKAPWRCRAGSRYLYIDEAGLVSYCSQRRGDPGIPLLEYTEQDLQREFFRRKGCESSCTIGCVRRASAIDEWRAYGAPLASENRL